MRYVLPLFFCLFMFALPITAEDHPAVSQPSDTNIQLVDSAQATAATESDSGFIYPMSAERKAKLISYSKFKNIWRFVSFLIEIIIMAILLYTGLSAKFRTWAESISKKKNSTIIKMIL